MGITLESSSTWQASPNGRCGLPSVLSWHSHLSKDFRGCPQHVPRSEKGSGVSRLEEGSAMCYCGVEAEEQLIWMTDTIKGTERLWDRW